ncbi:hypothetical protein [Cystobacter fuscus]|nr:hypothetical protein [Cystobacter fuscus]
MGRLRMDVQWELAQVRWSANQDRPRAVQLATEAREHWKRLGNQLRLTRASQWLAIHVSPCAAACNMTPLNPQAPGWGSARLLLTPDAVANR